ncbi:MAG TPA: tetratricopeptide repeat protein [Streptosporangiaceae bacterium]|nr:tetratricopeptide repeat protein [Streptosporangiaceae bacterium]
MAVEPEAVATVANTFAKEFAADLRRVVWAVEQRSGRKVDRASLAQAVHVSSQSLYAYLNGSRLPSAATLDALLIQLGVDGGQLRRLAEARDQVEECRRGRSRADVHALWGLPPDIPGFVARRAELAHLEGFLAADLGQPTTTVLTIVGTAGVGKTCLAVHWAHQIADRFPDGQLYVNLRGFDPSGQVMDPAAAMRRFLDALQVAPERIPADLDAQVALYRGQLARRRILVLLDNARDTAHVRPLLPGAPDCLVLITSRNQLTGLAVADGAHPVTLDLFSTAEARELLSHRIGSGRLTAEAGAGDEIITRCARLPLALAIVAARATTHPHLPLAALASELRDRNARLDTLTTDDQYTDVRAVFSWSYHTLTPDAARLFRLLSLHPGPHISVGAAASLAAHPIDQVRPLLAELTRASLLAEHIPGRYTRHDLLHAYATHLTHAIDLDEQRRAAAHRMLDHYLHTAHAADRLVHPARDPITLTPAQPGVTPEHPTGREQALAWFTAEHPVLLAAVEHATTNGFHTHTWQLAFTLSTFLDWRGHWHDLAHTSRTAVAAAQQQADPTVQARAHRILARAYTILGRFDDAHNEFHNAFDLDREAGDQVGQANTHHRLAYLWGQQGHLMQALDHAQQALQIFRAADHQRGRADALNNVGWYHALLGDHQQTLNYCAQALTLQQDLGNHRGQAETWDSLGYAHHHLGQQTRAITCYQHALALYQDLGERYHEAETLTHLGETHHAADNPEAAHDAWHQALTILNDLGHPDADTVRAKLHDLQSTTPAPPDNTP